MHVRKIKSAILAILKKNIHLLYIKKGRFDDVLKMV